MARRTAASVRFDPYWKVQVWEPVSLAWRDIQRAHPSEDAAWTAAASLTGRRVRLMNVYPGGRTPGEARTL